MVLPISTRASPMSRSRMRGSRSRHRAMRRWRRSGVAAGSVVQSGSFVSTKASMSDTVAPSKSRVPATISHSTAPNAQMSARLSTVFARACSGDM